MLALLFKTPILCDLSEEKENSEYSRKGIDEKKINEYIENNTYEKGIFLERRYYRIIARKIDKEKKI